MTVHGLNNSIKYFDIKIIQKYFENFEISQFFLLKK